MNSIASEVFVLTAYQSWFPGGTESLEWIYSNKALSDWLSRYDLGSLTIAIRLYAGKAENPVTAQIIGLSCPEAPYGADRQPGGFLAWPLVLNPCWPEEAGICYQQRNAAAETAAVVETAEEMRSQAGQLKSPRRHKDSKQKAHVQTLNSRSHM